jgi:Fe-S-cluster containining protein
MEITKQSIAEIKALAFKNKKEYATFFRQVAAKPPGRVDEAFQNLHEEVFAEVNCLECGNCCKSLGPKLNSADIRRISGILRIKASEFEQKYLRMDEDDDFVFSKMPCVFLEEDNTCRIYEDRPRACREYPHTDQRKIHQVLDITLKNMSTCPAVFEIVERLKKVKI